MEAELVKLRERGVRAVPTFAFRLQDGSEFVAPAQRVDTLLSDFQGDARIFCANTRGD